MKSIFAAATLLCASVVTAHAESFTFSGSSQTVNEVGAQIDGRSVGGNYSTGGSTTNFASGKKVAVKSQCMNWTAEPGGMMTGQGVCTASDSSGTFSVGFSCQADAKNTSANCWGKTTGMTGAYTGKTGTASWHSVNTADRKGITFSGTGMWND